MASVLSEAPIGAARTGSLAARRGSAVRRVLFVSYPFPPVGGAGVQRTTKFVKYLPEHGWAPSVLTVANPSVPAVDQSLLKDISPAVLVRRARTWEPSYAAKAAVASDDGTRKNGIRRTLKAAAHRMAKFLLQPDPQVLWMPGAVREGKRLLARTPHDAIVASGPPFSTFLIGAVLSKHTGLPLVLDYRDEWELSNAYLENKQLDSLSLLLQSRMQDQVVRVARAIIATTRCSADALKRTCQRARSTAQVTWIFNGFDPRDFSGPEVPAQRGDGRYRLAYIGTLWNLTSVEPLVGAVELLARQSPELAGRLELVFAGRRTPKQSALLARLTGLPCRLIEHPYLDHDSALALLKSADGLCALLSDVPGAERVLPAKIFEYMAARRTVIAVGPEGEMWDVLKRYPAAHLHRPSEVDQIAETIRREIERAGQGRCLDLGEWRASGYDRRSQTGQLASILNSIV